MKCFLKICLAVFLLVSIDPTNPVSAAVLGVSPPGGGDVGILGDVYPTIQAAIDAASPGDTIVIHAGLYSENIDINKWLILEGDGNGNNPAVDTIITASVASHPTVQIQASGVSETQRLIVRNMRVTGATGTGNPGSGIELDTASSFVTIESVTITGNTAHGLNADVMGIIEDLRVIDCNLSGNGGAGLNQNSYVSIDGLVINGCIVNNNANGLYLEGPLTGLTLTGGSFNNNIGTGTSGVGIYGTRIDDFAVKKPVSLSGFTANGNKRGLIFNKFFGPFSVSNAVISNNLEEGISVAPGASVSDSISFTNVAAENNAKWNLWFISYLGHAITNVSLDKVTATGSTDTANGYGIYLYASTNSTLSNVTVTDCVMSGNNTGLYLRAFNTTSVLTNVNVSNSDIVNNLVNGILITDNAAVSNKANNSQIVGNGFGVNNLDPNDVFDATLNCWGDATGPFHPITNPGGLGDPVSDNVDYYPWYLDCSFTNPAYKPVHNVTLNAYYDNIIPAVAAASSGDLITVDPVTLVENGQIVIDKNLTIKGIGSGKPTVKTNQSTGTSGNPRGWWLVNAGVELNLENLILDGSGYNVHQGVRILGHGTINNVDFKNIVYPPPVYAGLAVAAMGDGTVDVNGCTFENIGRVGVIYFGSGVNGSVYSNNTYTGKGPGDWLDYGVELGGGAVATIKNSTITDCNGIAASDGSTSAGILVTTYYGAGTAGTITNNILTNNSAGIAAGYDSADTSVIVARCNSIAGNVDYGIVAVEDAAGLDVDARHNWWGSATGPSGAGGGSGDAVSENVEFFPWLASTACEDIILIAADFVVDDDWTGLPAWTTVTVDGVDYYIGFNAFDTIQEAVDVAIDGNSIKVLEGKYFGAVINEDLTLVGGFNPGPSVIIDGPHYGGGAAGLKTAFKLDSGASGAEIRNFTVDCNSATNFYFAIFSRAADNVVADSLTINNPVQGITNYGGSGWQLTNNTLNYTEAAGGGGIAIYLGAYPPSYITLHDNLVKGNSIIASGTAPNFTCPGIAMCLDLRYGRYAQLTGNEDISCNKIVNNSVTGTGADSEVGIEIGVIGLEGDPNKIAATIDIIHDNLVRDNIIENTDWGIYFYTVSDLMVLGNKIIDCNDGIHIEDSHKCTLINFNSIYGNASYGVNNTGNVEVDATYNWWGNVSGPLDSIGTIETDGTSCPDVSQIKNADGLGDAVTEKVVYCAWLTVPPQASNNPCPAGDLDGDCDVDFLDLAILANNWLVGTE